MRASERVDRDEVFLEITRSVCPVCKRVLDAEVNARDDQVFLRKQCPDHGSFEARVYGDATMYVEAMRFNKPGTIPLETQTEVRDGCPLDCGLCPDHKQHACLGVIEVNSACNLDCPLCFADSGHQPDGFTLTLEQVDRALAAFVRAEGEPEVVMFSGGEPSIHPQILELLTLARTKPIRHVVLNTNGIRLARDAAFAPALAELGVSIYLQFDGRRRETHERLRGRDLREVKDRALDACAEAGLTVALVAAIERDVNDDEVGDVLRFGLAHRAVHAVVYQPVTHAGRHPEFDPRTRLTNSDVIHAIVDQTGGAFEASDFFPVPCCFPTCRSVTYLLVEGETVVPVPRVLRVEDHLDYVTNRVFPDPAIRRALEKLWSASAVAGSGSVADQLACATCHLDLPQDVHDATAKAFMVVIQDFQDPYTLNVKQLMKCCVEQLTPDGRLIPFCAYNSVGYREQVRASLTGVDVPAAVPNARELLPMLRVGPHGSKIAVDDGNGGHAVGAPHPGGSR
ncbi:MAG TPA: radical SAM protein [Actinomycetota bacterium]